MADFLEAVGRAKPATEFTGFLSDIQDIKTARATRELTERKTRAADIALRQSEEEEALGRQRLSFNSLRSGLPDMSDNQWSHLMGVAQSRGYDLSNDSAQRKDIKDFWGFLNSTEGKNTMVQNATIGLNDTRQAIDQLDAGMKSGEVKGKPEELEAQKQQLLNRENVLVNSLSQMGIEQADTDLTAEQKNIRAIQTSVKDTTGKDISYAEAFKMHNSMKGKSKEQWLLDIYADETKAGATDEEARVKMSEATNVWDEIHVK